MRLFGAEERRANASSRSELSNGATNSSTAGQPAQPAAEPKLRCLPCTGFAVTGHQARRADGEVQLCAETFPSILDRRKRFRAAA